MDNNEDGDGWKFGLSFICIGIIMVMGMGVFSLLYHKGLKGTNTCYSTISEDLFAILYVGDSVCNQPDPAPSNGELHFVTDKNGTILVGALAEYHCNEGYDILGPSKKVCMEEGHWEPKDKVFCVIKT